MIQFKIPGPPQGKARARTFYHKQAGRIVSMTPEKTANYENLVKIIAKEVAYTFYQSEELSLTVKAYYSIPKSMSKKKALDMWDGKIRPTKKPDADNVLKVVCDALNGVLYKDDTQIVQASVEKWYSTEPRVEVEISEVRHG